MHGNWMGKLNSIRLWSCHIWKMYSWSPGGNDLLYHPAGSGFHRANGRTFYSALAMAVQRARLHRAGDSVLRCDRVALSIDARAGVFRGRLARCANSAGDFTAGWNFSRFLDTDLWGVG